MRSTNPKHYGREFNTYLLAIDDVWYLREHCTRPAVVEVMRLAHEIEELERVAEEKRAELEQRMVSVTTRVTRRRV